MTSQDTGGISRPSTTSSSPTSWLEEMQDLATKMCCPFCLCGRRQACADVECMHPRTDDVPRKFKKACTPERILALVRVATATEYLMRDTSKNFDWPAYDAVKEALKQLEQGA